MLGHIFNPSYCEPSNSVVTFHPLTLRTRLDQTKDFLSPASCFQPVASQWPLGIPGRLRKHLHILCFTSATHLVQNGVSQLAITNNLFWVAAFEKEMLPLGNVLCFVLFLHALSVVECWLCTVNLKGLQKLKRSFFVKRSGAHWNDTSGKFRNPSESHWNLIQARHTLWFSAKKSMGE